MKDNNIGDSGQRAIAVAIAANGCRTLTTFEGFELHHFCHDMDLPTHVHGNSNVLEYLRKLSLTKEVKSARGGRQH
jgi:hypothetical protein